MTKTARLYEVLCYDKGAGHKLVFTEGAAYRSQLPFHFPTHLEGTVVKL